MTFIKYASSVGMVISLVLVFYYLYTDVLKYEVFYIANWIIFTITACCARIIEEIRGVIAYYE